MENGGGGRPEHQALDVASTDAADSEGYLSGSGRDEGPRLPRVQTGATSPLADGLRKRPQSPNAPGSAVSVSLSTGRGSTRSPRYDVLDATIFERTERDAKLDLFESDPLVDVVGLRSMGGQGLPRSPGSGQDIPDVLGPPRGPKFHKLGTLAGVFVPCLQNIMGIIFFIRLSWIVGIAGVGQSLLLVLICCTCTFLTGLSLSAIATNGAMKGGGPYYLIGRALGPEVGVSIGLCFFLGNAVAASLYVLGAVETLLDAIPGLSIFGANETQVPTVGAPSAFITEAVKTVNLHDMQVYGIICTVLLCGVVFGGVRILSRVSSAFLLPVLLSVALIFIGIFVAPRSGAPAGMTGIKWSTFSANWGPKYQRTNRAGIPAEDGVMIWNFEVLLGLLFPAVTGIMAGSNRSATLRDTQKSIPLGTLLAIAVSSTIYIVAVFLFGASASRDLLLRDRLLTATVAWPVAGVVQVGIILSTLGAALQSLTGAPRLLAAIANDDILPILKYFQCPDNAEPHLATVFTLLICIACVTLGNLDLITPIITMFFLLCYCGVNLSGFLLDLLDAPSWRPRWRYHHWFLSLSGAVLCVVIMFLIEWRTTILAFVLAGAIYYYVSVRGKAGDWGDGFKSAYFQLALRSLRSLGASAVHPKNWYPIPLIFCKPWGILPADVPCHPKLADFANCMKKKGRGMSIFVSIMEGEYKDKAEEARQACRLLQTYIEYKQCEGTAEVIVAPSVGEGFRNVVQSMGLGNLKPNIVCMRYPESWREEQHASVAEQFVELVNDCSTANKACVIVKGLDDWPGEYQKQYGSIDLYWIVRDGGLMLLLSQLLRTRESFDSCKIHVYCVESGVDESGAEELKADVRKFLYDLRMQADVTVISLKSWEEAGESLKEGEPTRAEAMEQFAHARKRIMATARQRDDVGGNSSSASMNAVGAQLEEKVNKSLYMTLKLNAIIQRYSRHASVVLVSLPPPPVDQPAYYYMEYVDLLVDQVPRILLVRGYRREVVTIFT